MDWFRGRSTRNRQAVWEKRSGEDVHQGEAVRPFDRPIPGHSFGHRLGRFADGATDSLVLHPTCPRLGVAEKHPG